MAIVTAFRFTPQSGAICIDQESWHIWRRKNWFNDHLYDLLPSETTDLHHIELIYGGTGHPPYHREVTGKARILLQKHINEKKSETHEFTVPELAEVVLSVFQSVHRRRVNDKLKYLFGFNTDEFNAMEFQKNGEKRAIKQSCVKDRALSIVQGQAGMGYSPFGPPVEACLIGVDKKYGFSAFVLKEEDGVLSFQSCWFESIGQGRHGAAIRFADRLNDRFLNTRRQGEGNPEGLFVLLESIKESMDHFGQNGGSIRCMLIDSNGETKEQRLLDIRDDIARLAFEIVHTSQNNLVSREKAVSMVWDLVNGKTTLEKCERTLFSNSEDSNRLGKLLRGYKIGEGNLPSNGPEGELFNGVKTATAGKGEKSHDIN